MGTDSKEVVKGKGNLYSFFMYVYRLSSQERRKKKEDKIIGKKVCVIFNFLIIEDYHISKVQKQSIL